METEYDEEFNNTTCVVDLKNKNKNKNINLENRPKTPPPPPPLTNLINNEPEKKNKIASIVRNPEIKNNKHDIRKGMSFEDDLKNAFNNKYKALQPKHDDDDEDDDNNFDEDEFN